VATRESEAPALWKQALLARGADDTVLTRMASGLWGRALRNPLSEAFGADGIPGLPGYGQRGAIQDIVQAAVARGDAEHFPLFGGQGVGLMHDVPGAGEVVERLVAEAQTVLARLR
jgi:NAD(P)H-dependent flavin oxidoreductase YrpB (nitropropane dioxygenase family)